MPKLLITRKMGWNIFIDLDGAVGKRGPNLGDDVLVVSLFLAQIQRSIRSFGKTPVMPTRAYSAQLQKAIDEFQAYIKQRYKPLRLVCDGNVDPIGTASMPFDRTLGWLHNEMMDQGKTNNTFIQNWPASFFEMASGAVPVPKLYTNF